MGIASGAYAGAVHVAVHQAGRGQLMPADAPEIKMVRTDPKWPELSGNLLFIIDKLGTTGPQGRSYGSGHLPWIATEFGNHARDGAADDVGHTAPPTAVNIGHHLSLRFIKHHRLAVRRLDQQPNTRHIGNQRIGRHRIRLNSLTTVDSVPGDGADGCAMVLTGVNVNAAIGHLPQPIPVGRDYRRVVTHPMAQVKGIIGGLADSPRSAHDGMDQPWDTQERLELKQIIILFL